ncbi:GerAB/ArcD/ProY family transporter [Cohnella kolymensis]|uniref:GerAB/ArcD/ProY family transporter n=1 Tax=Cohnella kolymensis TaxID=1590652 RepID=UPI0006960817|nr:endospore germination permease [Cohnella kolymensis]
MAKYFLSGRQLAWLVAVFIVAPAVINMPQHLARLAYMDAWVTQMLPVIYGFAVCYVYYRLAKVFPGKNFFEICFQIAGKYGGALINIVFLVHIWFILAKNTNLFIGFIKTNLLLRTPYEVSLFLLILVLIYYGKTSVEVATRVNDMFFALIAFLIITIPLLLSNDISIFQMLPIFVEPLPDLGIANALTASSYGDITVFAAFLPVIANSKMLYTSFRHGLSIAALLITWILVTEICVLGPSITSREIYPTYALIQQIHITDFLDRMEIFIFSIYFPSFIVCIVIAFLAILTGLGSFDRSNRPQAYNKTAGWFLLMTLVFAFEGTPEVSTFANYAYPVYVFAVQPLALVIVFLLSFRKKAREGSPTQDQKSSESNQPSAASFSASSIRSFRRWKLFTYILIVLGIASVIVGWMVAKDVQWIARVCAAVYMLVLILLVFTTYREMKSVET